MDKIQHNRAGLVLVEMLALLKEMLSIMSGDLLNHFDQAMQDILHDRQLADTVAKAILHLNDTSIVFHHLKERAGKLSGMNDTELLDRTFEKLWNATEVEYCTDNGDPEFRGNHRPSDLVDLAKKYQERLTAIMGYWDDMDVDKLVSSVQLELKF